MLKCRLWNERGSSYVCALCRHPALSRQPEVGRRYYSDASNSSPNRDGLPGGDGSWGSGSVRRPGTASGIPPRPLGPVSSCSGWGAQAIGGRTPTGIATGPTATVPDSQRSTPNQGDAALDGLLPHEIAARKRLLKSAPKPRETPQTAPQTIGRLDTLTSRNNARFSRTPRDAPATLRGSDNKDTANRTKEWQDRRRNSDGPNKNDWRHRDFSGVKKFQTSPVPHHSHAVREELGKPLGDSGQKSSLGETTGTWALLDRKLNPNRPPIDDTPSAMSREDFIARFQERMIGKPSGAEQKIPQADAKSKAPWELADDGFGDVVVREEIVSEQKLARQGKEIDETYEIDRDPRRRDKAGSRRGERVPKKSASQQRWAEQNQEWGAKGATRAAELRKQKAEERARRKAEASASTTPTIFLPEFISVGNLGTALKMKPQVFLRALAEMGFEDITEDSIMTGETASLVAMEFGFEPTVDTGSARDLKPRPPPEDVTALPPRPSVVTIMGHVDHGKTTLLDYLRKSSVAAQEHGGITQHIGAFVRGANVTDIVVLVVAADDSVKPQTLEALKHARAAKVPIIVAINKCDKEDARPDQVKSDLARHGVEIEDFGGDVQVVCVSGKTGLGMGELEENIAALSEIQDVRAEVEGMAEAWVLEASVKSYGKAPPGTPVEVMGWREELPAAGDEILQAPDEDRARTAVEYREEMREREASSKQLAEQEQREREAKLAAEIAAEAEEAHAEGDGTPAIKTVNFRVRADVVGSVEAVCATISEIGNNEVKPRILTSSAGQVSESDVEHAAASNSVIVNFNSNVAAHVKRLAEEKGVRMVDHSVIYHLADEIKQVMSDSLADKISIKVTGEAEVLQIFPINIKGRAYKNIAGCRVRNGLVTKTTKVRIMRKGEQIFDGKFEDLKHGKKDVTETYDEIREKRSL
ncbi:Translation initiation factor IF-2 [Colletotrichum orbiculare MAFF 240422]|uniref:Translation initiation factor IF-2 n=1 Tax=Colletotrichum orbiculare (strain 104-T / ATCC 96160 / CBS 514.97 / LARS 414 / MAFF 240422) TaxID=1213857 RepID=A0A484G3G8_COLOR|nr:Translation initiation factor IF-2 [Colletotrichum orbiculare MAFF 240422]